MTNVYTTSRFLEDSGYRFVNKLFQVTQYTSLSGRLSDKYQVNLLRSVPIESLNQPSSSHACGFFFSPNRPAVLNLN